MKTLTVRLPDTLLAEIEAESRARQVAKSDVVRERLSARSTAHQRPSSLQDIAHLIGSVKGLPTDLSTNKKKYSNVPMSFADACLVRMSEVLPNPTVLTTDSDFHVYRRHGRQVIPCVTPRQPHRL